MVKHGDDPVGTLAYIACLINNIIHLLNVCKANIWHCYNIIVYQIISLAELSKANLCETEASKIHRASQLLLNYMHGATIYMMQHVHQGYNYRYNTMLEFCYQVNALYMYISIMQINKLIYK